jgi:osmotically-inducible protein OsmY
MKRAPNSTPAARLAGTPARRAGLALALVAAAALLAACQREPDEPTVGQRIDGAVASVERKAEEVKADTAAATAEARADAKAAADTAGTAVKDAAITAAVNAKLAADPDLSAIRIDVDTTAGRVALRGDAPTMAARDRAATLAREVDGVVAVDNELAISPKKS